MMLQTAIKRYDRSGMKDFLESFPEQVIRSKAIGLGFQIPRNIKKTRYKNIVFTGLGGSAIAGDLLRSAVSAEAGIPIIVNRNYTLPAFCGQDTLVIASSYSGNTEETLSAYADARRKKTAIIAITSGGKLEKLAFSDGVGAINIPAGFLPRCAVAFSFFTALLLLGKAGVIKDKSRDIDETVRVLENMRRYIVGIRVPDEKNISKRIAKDIFGRAPIVYAAADHMESVAVRWHGQFAENSKNISFAGSIPEMCHNEIVGFDRPSRILKGLAVIMLRDKGDNQRTSKRMDIIGSMVKRYGITVTETESIGNALAARIFSLIYTGDFASYYLALLNGRDPTPVERIAHLKKELAKS